MLVGSFELNLQQTPWYSKVYETEVVKLDVD